MIQIIKKILGISSTHVNNVDDDSALNNAIDNRDNAVSLIVQKLQSATGSNADILSRLTVLVVNSSGNPLDTSWVDDDFISQLRLALDNNLLQYIGIKELDAKIITIDQLDQYDANPVVKDSMYLSWGKKQLPIAETPHVAQISVTQQRGSLFNDIVTLDSSINTIWHIGRGLYSNRGNVSRQNQIAIRDDDEALMEVNRHVSSSQADILFVPRKGFFIKACAGGCRSMGGVATKIINEFMTTELKDTITMYPLVDGDVIELGKSVNLLFKLQN